LRINLQQEIQKLPRYRKSVPGQEQEKNRAAGFNGVVDCDQQEAQGNKQHPISVRKAGRENGAMKQGRKMAMNRNEKTDERSCFVFRPLEALLIGCNFFQKIASYLVECSGTDLHYTR
jgi:hypothetical protein